MGFDFESSMQALSDVELIKVITTDRNDYQEGAIVEAEKEFARRNLSAGVVEKAKNDIATQQGIKAEKANAALDLHWKILAIIFPGIFQLMVSGLLKGDGFDRQARQLSKWTFIGLGLYLILIVFITATGG
ncbi:MAG: hypothetical protein J0H92_19070 [Sphingobacteriales bacterium]|nr:hypothetical protein [Sphingobacteriales bacterium]OJW31870.1 MAG: hypothetical protein BGO54_15660 [Sphingobacteriales bacterium 46-32]